LSFGKALGDTTTLADPRLSMTSSTTEWNR